MSLQLWLPLNGNFVNQGLAPGIKVTNNNDLVTFTANSRLGGLCAVFNGDKLCVLKTNYRANFGTGNFSVAFWIKIDSSLDESNISFPYIISSRGYLTNSLGFAIIYSKSSKKIGLRVANGSNNDWETIDVDMTQYFGKWIHIIVVKDNLLTKHGCFYINGEKIDLENTLTSYDIGNNEIWIGTDTDNNYNPLPMQLADVRIYDHALSDKEAKELAKGLMLHYKLDNNGYGLPNMLTLSILTTTPWSYAIKDYNAFYNGKNCYRMSSSLLYSRTADYSRNILYNSSITFKENTAYTLSLDCMDVVVNNTTGNLLLFFKYTDGNNGPRILTRSTESLTLWVHKTITSDPTKTVDSLYTTYSNSTELIYIANLKLEESPVETRYSPSIDNLPTTVSDLSGYRRNNGTFVGTQSYVFDSPKYDCALHFTGSNCIKSLNTMSYSDTMRDELTTMFWIRKTGTGTNDSYIYIGIESFYLYQNNVILMSWQHANSSLSYNNNNSWRTPVTIPTNEWVHIAITFKNGVHRVYKNGVVTVNDRSDTGLFIRGYKGNTIGAASASIGNTGFVGDISDVRVYSIALSTNDILEIYKTSASIDNKSNIYSREFIENNNKVSIQQNGQLLMDAVEEDSSTASFYDTKVVKGQLIYEY